MKISGMGINKGNGNTNTPLTKRGSKLTHASASKGTQKDAVILSAEAQNNSNSAINPQSGINNPANSYQRMMQNYLQVPLMKYLILNLLPQKHRHHFLKGR